jgi:hypothetical protein
MNVSQDGVHLLLQPRQDVHPVRDIHVRCGVHGPPDADDVLDRLHRRSRMSRQTHGARLPRMARVGIHVRAGRLCGEHGDAMRVHVIRVTGQTAQSVERHQRIRTELADLDHESVHGFDKRYVAPAGCARSRLRNLRVGVPEHPRLACAEDSKRSGQLGPSPRARSPRGSDDGSRAPAAAC